MSSPREKFVEAMSGIVGALMYPPDAYNAMNDAEVRKYCGPAIEAFADADSCIDPYRHEKQWLDGTCPPCRTDLLKEIFGGDHELS